MKYRNELKYICSWEQLEIFQHKIAPFVEKDAYVADDEGFYRIRSLYFDTYTDRCMRENESGIDNREKFRIRIYNSSESLIRLEIKYKLHGLTKKESCSITREQYDSIVEGRIEDLWPMDYAPLRRLYVAVKTEYMQPKVIVDYERTPFVCVDGNVRITFDRNIEVSDRIEDFFEESLAGKPILNRGQHLLEIKYDEFLPGYISDALGYSHFKQTAFSKYYLSRRVLQELREV